MSTSNVMHEEQLNLTPRMVFTTETGALAQGQAVCWDRDYYTANTGEAVTDAWGKRTKIVALPSQSNNLAFAGVVSQAYSANANGQWIEIYECLPGHCALVYVSDTSVTIGQGTFLWPLASSTNNGYFTATPMGMMGRGCVRAMQTLTAAGLCLVEFMGGEESGLVEIIPTATLTAGGAITCMVGGSTFFDGAATPATDCTFTIASGTYIGQLKRFYQDGDLTTNDVELTIVAEGLDGTTDVTNIQLDGNGDDTTIVWTGSKWKVFGNVGSTLS